MPYDTMRILSNRTRALFVSSEIYPLAKTGGLADVCGALPRFMAQNGDIDILLMLPGYPSVLEMLENKTLVATLPGLPGGDASLLAGSLPHSDVRVLVLDQPKLFGGRTGLYSDEAGQDWPDNAVRFAALCHAAVRVACGQALPSWRADIVHCHDWHTGLIPLLISAMPGPRPKTIMTIHNLAFQGNFPAASLADLDLPQLHFSPDTIEFYGQISFLKAGILYADKVTTVSPSYAEEIMQPEFGMGFDGVLAVRKQDLIGILNGIDLDVWNPQTDPTIAAVYSLADPRPKGRCKEMLQESLGLHVDANAPLLVFVARLELQKMADILLEILPALLERSDVQLAVLGTGAPDLEQSLAAWPSRAAGRVAVRIGYSEDAAHQLLSGGDMLLHGARFEPCGLTPIYALRYGTIPIVTTVGGLRDTTIDASDKNLEACIANAIHFTEPTAEAMLNAIDSALALFARTETWRQLQDSAMRSDFSWHVPAAQYRQLYREMIDVDA